LSGVADGVAAFVAVVSGIRESPGTNTVKDQYDRTRLSHRSITTAVAPFRLIPR
jgi:hypothetical protein